MPARHALACGAALLALAAAPVSAHAQFGGLVKKAKGAAAEAAGRAAADRAVEKVAGSSPAGAAAAGRSAGALPGGPLTEQSFAAVLRGLKRTNAVLAEAEQLQARASTAGAEVDKLIDAHPGEVERYQQQSTKAANCQRFHMYDLAAARRAAMDKRMRAVQNNPAEQQRLMAVVQKHQPTITQAQMKGDTAALMRAMVAMNVEMTGENPIAVARADTASAVQKCGAVPPKPAWIVQLDSARARNGRADAAFRDKEREAVAAGAAASGMDAARYNVMRERLEILYRLGAKRVSNADATETQLVERHRAELDQLKNVLEREG